MLTAVQLNLVRLSKLRQQKVTKQTTANNNRLKGFSFEKLLGGILSTIIIY